MYSDVRSDKRVTSARVGRLRPLRKLSNDVKFEDDSEVLEEIMDISPKAAKPVELSPVSNGIYNFIFILYFITNSKSFCCCN